MKIVDLESLNRTLELHVKNKERVKIPKVVGCIAFRFTESLGVMVLLDSLLKATKIEEINLDATEF